MRCPCLSDEHASDCSHTLLPLEMAIVSCEAYLCMQQHHKPKYSPQKEVTAKSDLWRFLLPLLDINIQV